MTVETGMLYKGKVVPNTSWVSRSSSAWYPPKDDDTFFRQKTPSLIIYHWTAGPRRLGEPAAIGTYNAMQARRKADGTDTSVSAQFVLSDDGSVWQLADLSMGCYHAEGEFSRRGIGIEYAFPGTQQNAKRFSGDIGEVSTRFVGGRKVVCVQPTKAALDTAVRLSETLSSLFGIPKVTNVSREKFTPQKMKTAVGVAEHFHAAKTTKLDAGGFFVDHHLQFGWEGK